jgi:serine protease Do/serine protease DegQ
MTRVTHLVRVLALAAAVTALPAHAQLPARVGTTPVPSLAPIIKKVSPAVVNIATKSTVQAQQRNPLFDDPFFRRYFDLPDQQPRQRQAQAAGSGVIVDAKNGYVLTNAHVIEDANEVTVTLLDDRSVKAEVVGADKGSDIAVLKIKATNLTDMPFADSSKIEVGDFVVAIGNPFGLQHTVTSGIVSGLGRANINPEGRGDSYEDFIQTDAAINPGNSGGALVNLSGELMGVNSAILSGSGGNIGIGFAIPANMAHSIMDQLIKYGAVKRGRLGVVLRAMSPEIAESLGLKGNKAGALIGEVVEGSAADKAGIKGGDVITSINGKTIKTETELRNTIGLMRIGEKVDLGLIREGKVMRLSATVGEGESAPQPSGGGTNNLRNAMDVHPGFEGSELGDVQNAGGVSVKSVAPRSPAALRGLRANDVIMAVGRTRVTNLAQLRTLTKDANSFALQIRRGTATVVIVME